MGGGWGGDGEGVGGGGEGEGVSDGRLGGGAEGKGSRGVEGREEVEGGRDWGQSQ